MSGSCCCNIPSGATAEGIKPEQAPGFVLQNNDPFPPNPCFKCGPDAVQLMPQSGDYCAPSPAPEAPNIVCLGPGTNAAPADTVPMPPPYLPQPGDGPEPLVSSLLTAWRSEPEWRAHNKAIMSDAHDAMHRANMSEFMSRRTMETCASSTDRAQRMSTERLRARAHELHCRLSELERAVVTIADQSAALVVGRQQLKTSIVVLRLPADIVQECLDRRRDRPGAELVADKADQELRKEKTMLAEATAGVRHLLELVDKQQEANNAIKARQEMDWSDKKETYAIESINIGYKNDSPDIMLRPGAVRQPEGQSGVDTWAVVTQNNISLLQGEIEKSVELLARIDTTMTTMARNLRKQADNVDAALSERIAHTEECRRQLHNNLMQVLQRIVETESQIRDLKQALRNHGQALKKVQTRLHNRLLRPGVENCRDAPQIALLDEDRQVEENLSSLRAELARAEQSLADMVSLRAGFEQEFTNKQKALEIDRRCQLLRASYPSVSALTGF